MKRWIHAKTDNWPDASVFEEAEDDYEWEDVWDMYLSGPEVRVNDELKIFAEPSVQGHVGSMFLYDDSGEDRFDDVEIDFGEWDQAEFEMAIDSNSAEEYEDKYRAYVKELCGI